MFGKIILVFILVAVVGLAVMCGSQFLAKKAEEPPDVDRATWAIQTSSRVYYTNDYEWQGEDLILNGYWVMIDSQWVYRADALRLTRAFGTRGIMRR